MKKYIIIAVLLPILSVCATYLITTNRITKKHEKAMQNIRILLRSEEEETRYLQGRCAVYSAGLSYLLETKKKKVEVESNENEKRRAFYERLLFTALGEDHFEGRENTWMTEPRRDLEGRCIDYIKKYGALPNGFKERFVVAQKKYVAAGQGDGSKYRLKREYEYIMKEIEYQERLVKEKTK